MSENFKFPRPSAPFNQPSANFPNESKISSACGLDQEDVSHLARMQGLDKLATGKRHVSRNARLFRKQDKVEMLYVICFGQFKLIGDDSNGHQRIAGFYVAGQWMGLDAIASGRHNFGAVALEDSELWEIPLAAIGGMLSAEPAMQKQFMRVMSEALCNEYDDGVYAGAPLDTRFARFLFKLGEKNALLGKSSKSYRLSMSRSDIGSYLGTTAESVSRVIARFNAGKIASINGRDVELLDCAALDAIINSRDRSPKRAALH